MWERRLPILLKKITAVIAAAAILTAVIAYALPASQRTGEFITPNATDKNLLSCRFSQEEPENAAFDLNRLSDTKGFKVLLENGGCRVLYSEETCGIRVLDKKSGYIWGGITAEDREYLNSQWCDMADSLVTVTYLNSECMSNQASLSGEDFTVTYTADGNRALFSAESVRLGISFKFSLILHEESLQIKMDEESLSESGEYLLESLYFMPFFGAVRENTADGYMLVPDGPGALIRYDKSTKYIAPYSQRVYGADMATDELKRLNNLMAKRANDYLTDQTQATVPIFGVSHGKNNNAFLAVIDGGEGYATVYASPAGFVTDFNYVTARFDFRTTYLMSSGNGSNGITVNQKNPNNCIPSVSFYFLNGGDANYSGMAARYRELLKEDGTLKKSERTDENIPLRVDILGGDIKNGRITDKYVPFTTAAQAEEIRSSLEKDGIVNLTYVYSGWKKRGLNASRFDSTALSKKLGSFTSLDALRKKTEASGGRFVLAANPVFANSDQLDPKRDGILSMSKKTPYYKRDNSAAAYQETYIVKPELAVDAMKEFIGKYKDFYLNFNGVGTAAYSDYARDKTILREKTADVFAKTLKKAKGGIALNNPNKYMWSVTDEYFDLPLENSQLIYETDTVPFLPMVLKGSIDYYTPYINQGYYTEDYILKMTEYGAYPSFLMMYESNESLSGTPSEDYFSICFDDWHSAAAETYKRMNEVLKKTEGREMTAHTVLRSGLVRVDYTGDLKIYINYCDEPLTADGITAAAKQCTVVGGN